MARRRRGARITAAERSQAARTFLSNQGFEAEPYQSGLLGSTSQLGRAPNELVIEI